MLFVLLAFLPYACLAGTILLRVGLGEKSGAQPFASAIEGALAWSGAVWLASNLGSLCNILGRPWLAAVWLFYGAALAWFFWRARWRLAFPRPPGGAVPAAMAIAALCALLAALLYPPNMWDVHSYHLARVMHWLQNGTMAPYPTNIARQIGMPPFNSMIAMQSLGMGGGDYFVNLGQWFAFIGLVAGAWRIAAQLGASSRARLLAALFIATLPNALIHASNTESSNIVSFWLLACASLELEWLRTRARRDLLKFGLCLGFAVLSKGSAYVIGLPFAIPVVWACLRHPRTLLGQGLAAALCALLLNAPHYARAHEAYGSIVGGAEKNILVRPTAGTFAVNALYGFLLHEPWLIKQPLRPGWQGLASALGADEANRQIFPWGGLDNAVDKFELGDASTPNPIHALVLGAMLIGICMRRFRPPRFYSRTVAGSFCLFFLMLTWHPWAARIQTPLFALAAPLAGMYINGWRREKWRKGLVIILLAWTFLSFQGGYRRIGFIDDNGKNFLYTFRPYLYFNNYRRHAQEFLDAVNFLASRQPESIGLAANDNALEYPVWALLAQRAGKMPRIFHLTRPEDMQELKPRFIIVLGREEGDIALAPRVLELAGDEYLQAFPPKNRPEAAGGGKTGRQTGGEAFE